MEVINCCQTIADELMVRVGSEIERRPTKVRDSSDIVNRARGHAGKAAETRIPNCVVPGILR